MMAEDTEDMARQLRTLSAFLRERNLDLNPDKSMIMKTGRGQETEYAWEWRDRKGQILNLKETKEIRYLWVTLGRSNMLEAHLNNKLDRMRKGVGFLKTRAAEAPDRWVTAAARWERAQLPATLYATELTCPPQDWF